MNKNLLNKFKNVPKEFEEFLLPKISTGGTWRRGAFYINFYLNGTKTIFGSKKKVIGTPWTSLREPHTKALGHIYKKVCEKDLVVSWGKQVFSCNKNQYKQVIYNIRNRLIKKIKKTVISSSASNLPLKDKIKVIQQNKISLHQRIYISVYDLENDSYTSLFRPIVNSKYSPRKKDCALIDWNLFKIK